MDHQAYFHMQPPMATDSYLEIKDADANDPLTELFRQIHDAALQDHEGLVRDLGVKAQQDGLEPLFVSHDAAGVACVLASDPARYGEIYVVGETGTSPSGWFFTPSGPEVELLARGTLPTGSIGPAPEKVFGTEDDVAMFLGIARNTVRDRLFFVSAALNRLAEGALALADFATRCNDNAWAMDMEGDTDTGKLFLVAKDPETGAFRGKLALAGDTLHLTTLVLGGNERELLLVSRPAGQTQGLELVAAQHKDKDGTLDDTQGVADAGAIGELGPGSDGGADENEGKTASDDGANVKGGRLAKRTDCGTLTARGSPPKRPNPPAICTDSGKMSTNLLNSQGHTAAVHGQGHQAPKPAPVLWDDWRTVGALLPPLSSDVGIPINELATALDRCARAVAAQIAHDCNKSHIHSALCHMLPNGHEAAVNAQHQRRFVASLLVRTFWITVSDMLADCPFLHGQQRSQRVTSDVFRALALVAGTVTKCQELPAWCRDTGFGQVPIMQGLRFESLLTTLIDRVRHRICGPLGVADLDICKVGLRQLGCLTVLARLAAPFLDKYCWAFPLVGDKVTRNNTNTFIPAPTGRLSTGWHVLFPVAPIAHSVDRTTMHATALSASTCVCFGAVMPSTQDTSGTSQPGWECLSSSQTWAWNDYEYMLFTNVS